MIRLPAAAGLLAGALLVGGTPAFAQASKGTVSLLYLELAVPHVVASTSLEAPPPAEEGVQGARLAVQEETQTGRFLGLGYDMQEALPATDEAVLDAARAALAAGRRVVVADLPAPLLLRLADLPEAKDALIFDIVNTDDALRGADCRHNVLHVAPSRAMLADALMQYLVTKDWRHIFLLTGRAPADKLYADALRKSARKFQVKIADDREWTFNPAAQQADTGHYQINTEVADATGGVSYDVLVAADEAGAFADQLAYRTRDPRPIAGSAGLVATVWTPLYDEYAGAQLQLRFRRRVHRPMTGLDYNAWAAVRAVGEAAVRAGTADPAKLEAYLRGPDFQLGGYKGAALSFRPWDGQMRQPILLADDHSLVSISPQAGYLHQFNVLDTLGVDQPESTCHP
jgi:ABC transporter substrate binding protein (PQQ-dependent alcohol dehydrogenase system)